MYSTLGLSFIMDNSKHLWYTLPPEIAAATLEVDPGRGLEEGEAVARLARFGENRLIEATPRPV
jgi:P-type Ca2+ transporter type 2C